jgi:hypothetical protein
VYVLQDAEEQECLERAKKVVEQGRQTGKQGATDPGQRPSAEGMRLQALRTVMDSGALSLSMRTVQQIMDRKKRCSSRKLKAPRCSRDEQMQILIAQACPSVPYCCLHVTGMCMGSYKSTVQVARSEATARDLWRHAQL